MTLSVLTPQQLAALTRPEYQAHKAATLQHAAETARQAVAVQTALNAIKGK